MVIAAMESNRTLTIEIVLLPLNIANIITRAIKRLENQERKEF